MTRLRLLAIAVLAVTALVAGVVALALGPGGSTDRSPSAGASPSPLPTPTDAAAGVEVPAGVQVSTGEIVQSDANGHDVRRTYVIVAPEQVAPSTPLIVVLHGRNATPAEEVGRDELAPYVAAGQAVLVYPVGYNQAWNDGDGCCGLGVALGLDDVSFVAQVTTAVRDQFGLTGPTDLVGFSNGGRLAYTVACEEPSRFAAIATVAAAPPDADCPQAGTPVPLFAGFTLDDPELPTAEDPEPVTDVLAGLEATWVERNQCVGDPTVAVAGQATVRNWTACAEGSVLETVAWRTGGHIWPKAGDVGDPDATDLLWSFLSGVHQRAALAGR